MLREKIFNPFASELIPPSDIQQSKIRLLFVGAVVVLSVSPLNELSNEVLYLDTEFQVAIAYFAISIFIYVLTLRQQSAKDERQQFSTKLRFMWLFFDLAALSTYTAISDNIALYLLPFYITCVLGYGFRFGGTYFVVALFAALGGFTFAKEISEYLRFNEQVVHLYYVCMIFVPLYSLLLLKAYWDAMKALELSTARLNQLLGLVSHEFRAPLQSLVALSEMTEEEATRESGLEQSTLGNLRTLRTISKQLVDISTFIAKDSTQSWNQVEKKPSMNLFTTVRSSIDACRVRALKKRLRLLWYIELGLPNYCDLDGRMFSGIITNLLDNAIKYTEKGTIRLSVDFARSEGPTDVKKLRLLVTDQGPGMASFRETNHSSSTDPLKSVGLGLGIVDTYVDALGGEIFFRERDSGGLECEITLPLAITEFSAVSSTPEPIIIATSDKNRFQDPFENRREEDNIFFVYFDELQYETFIPLLASADCILLPTSEAAAGIAEYFIRDANFVVPPVFIAHPDDADRLPAATYMNSTVNLDDPRQVFALSGLCTNRTSMGKTSDRPLRNIQCLVFDDSRLVAETTSMILKRAGAECQIFSDPDASANSDIQGGIDVVVTDLHFSKTKGTGFLQDLRARFGPKCAIVVLTGDTTSGLHERLCRLGADDVLLKPSTSSDLSVSIVRSLSYRNPVRYRALATEQRIILDAHDDANGLLSSIDNPTNFSHAAKVELEYLMYILSRAVAEANKPLTKQTLHRINGLAAMIGAPVIERELNEVSADMDLNTLASKISMIIEHCSQLPLNRS